MGWVLNGEQELRYQAQQLFWAEGHPQGEGAPRRLVSLPAPALPG